jgi:hypothetical protein
VLAAVQGRAIGPNWRESMLLDVGMCARYLVTLPLLILATPVFRRNLQTIVHHFPDAELVRERERDSFFANITAMLRWRDSVVAAVVLAALAAGDSVLKGEWSPLQNPGTPS